MGSLSDQFENKLLNDILGGVAHGLGANLFAALYTVTPGEGTAGTQANYAGYARVSKARNQTNFPAAAAGAISNGTTIVFPTATGDQTGNIVGVALLDADLGNVVAYSALLVGKPVLNGDTPSFGVGDLDFTMD